MRALGRIAGTAAAALGADEHRLRPARVAAGADDANAGHELDLAVDLCQQARRAHGVELLRPP